MLHSGSGIGRFVNTGDARATPGGRCQTRPSWKQSLGRLVWFRCHFPSDCRMVSGNPDSALAPDNSPSAIVSCTFATTALFEILADGGHQAHLARVIDNAM